MEGAERCRGAAHPIKSMAHLCFDKTWVWGEVCGCGGADWIQMCGGAWARDVLWVPEGEEGCGDGDVRVFAACVILLICVVPFH